MLPLREGLSARQTHDYKRNGVVSLYAALEIASGRVVGECREPHTGADFLQLLKRLSRTFRTRDLHVVLDNSSTHSTPTLLPLPPASSALREVAHLRGHVFNLLIG